MNSGRYWKEEEIQAVKDALEVQDEIDYSSLMNSIFSSFQSQTVS